MRSHQGSLSYRAIVVFWGAGGGPLHTQEVDAVRVYAQDVKPALFVSLVVSPSSKVDVIPLVLHVPEL